MLWFWSILTDNYLKSGISEVGTLIAKGEGKIQAELNRIMGQLAPDR